MTCSPAAKVAASSCRKAPVMKNRAVLLAIVGACAFSPPAHAVGCFTGAVAGGIAGHYAGHHAVLGAIGGCIVGHHMANEQAKDKAAAAAQGQQAPPPGAPAPNSGSY